MILYVSFSDGSNSWVSLPADRHAIAKHWRRWIKYHPDTARPIAYGENSWYCYPDFIRGGYVVHHNNASGPNQYKHYKYLGHALAALERMGGNDNEN